MALFSKKNKDDEAAKKVTSASASAPASPMPGMVMPGSGSKEEKSKKSKPKKLKSDTKSAYRVLMRPIISEKGSFLAEENTYLFQVNKKATRREVANAIDAVYGIMPLKVRLVNISGKGRKYRNVQGWKADWKKAMVSLPPDKKIDLYEGV